MRDIRNEQALAAGPMARRRERLIQLGFADCAGAVL